MKLEIHVCRYVAEYRMVWNKKKNNVANHTRIEMQLYIRAWTLIVWNAFIFGIIGINFPLQPTRRLYCPDDVPEVWSRD